MRVTIVVLIALLFLLIFGCEGNKMASMVNEVKNIYIRAYVESRENGKSEDRSRKDALDAVRDAGYFYDNGKWQKSKKGVKKDKTSVDVIVKGKLDDQVCIRIATRNSAGIQSNWAMACNKLGY